MPVEPRISILLPTHNGERFIRRAIESVRKQNFTDWELIIINDGSTDRTGALVTEIKALDSRIRMILFHKNHGIQRALNEGLIQARGEYIARIDDDDEWQDPEKLSKQLAFMQQNPHCVLLGTGMIVQDETGNELYRFENPCSDRAIRERILYRNCFSHSTVLFKRSVALSAGGYSESPETLHMEDYELWLRMGLHGRLANLPDLCVRFTTRADAISGKHKKEQLTKQLVISRLFKNHYPHYLRSRIYGVLRLWAYVVLGQSMPRSLLQKALAWYKRG